MGESEEEALRAYKISVEYKMLGEASPSGVMVLPEIDNIRKFYGVIFIRTGAYRRGIFRFTMELPLDYNSEGSFPIVTFSPSIFNPLVDPVTGKMALTTKTKVMNTWDPTKHFLSTVLTCVKRIFTAQSFDNIEPGAAPNEIARHLFDSNRETFNAEVLRSVETSLSSIHLRPEDKNPFRFCEPIAAHGFLRETLVGGMLADRDREFQRLNRGESDEEDNEAQSARMRRDSYAEARSMLESLKDNSHSGPSREEDGSRSSRSSRDSNKLETPKSGRLQSFYDLSPLSPSTPSTSP